MKRRTIIAAVILIALAVIAGIAVQIVLMTDLPARLIVDAVAKETGLSLRVESVSIRWAGPTVVRRAEVTGPLDSEPFVAVETIELRHHSLPILLLTRSLGLRSVHIVRPELSLWRDEEGRWNVQNVADHLAALPSKSGGSLSALPDVEVEQAVVHIAEPNGLVHTVGPIQFNGTKEKGSVWRFALEGAEGVGVSGELVEGGNWAHRVQFDLAPTATLQESLVGQVIADLRVAGRWDGRLETGNLLGTLRLAELRAGSTSASGAVGIATQARGLAVSPESLVLIEPNLGGQQLQVAGGRILVGPEELTIDGVRLGAGAGSARLEGRWGLDAQAGDLTATWAWHVPGGGGQYQGEVHAEVRSPSRGLKQARLTASAEGQTGSGQWHLAFETSATGSEWSQSAWHATLQECLWRRNGQEIDLGGTTAEVLVDGSRARLAALTLPRDAGVETQGQWDRQTGQWTFRLDTTDLRLSEASSTAWSVRLAGEGDSRNAVITELRMDDGLKSVAGQAQVSLETHQVHDAHLSAQWPDRVPYGGSGQTQNRGRWTAEIDVAGTIQPLALESDVVLRGRDVRLGKRQVAQLEVPVRAQVDAEQIAIATTPFTLLGGLWQFSGRHDLVDQETQLDLTIDNLSLRHAAEMAGSPIQSGGLAHARLQVMVPEFDISRTLAYGRWEATDLSIPPLEAASGQGQIRIAGGLVQCDEIRLVQDQGRAEGALRFRLDQPQRLTVNLSSSDWPVRLENQPAVLLADGSVEAQVDLQAGSADGKGTLAGRLQVGDDQLGRVNTTIQLAGRTLIIEQLSGTLLEGSLEGSARIPLDKPTASIAQLQWQDVHPDRLAPWIPQAARAGGVLSGSLAAYQTDESTRPLGPLRIDMHSVLAEGRFGAAEIRDANVVAYLSGNRFLVDRCDLRLFDGEVSLRGRVSPHLGQFHLAITADVNNLDISQIAHAADPNASAVVGRLSGTGTVITSADWRRLSGQADLRVSQSDLANNVVIRTLYNALSLKLGPSVPEGSGSVDLLFAGTRVRIPSFVYFNRGVEVRGAATFEDLSLGADSPIEGYAVGSTRVLKGVRLPGVKQLDKLMSSLQSGLASVTIGGTAGQAKVNVVPLPVVGDALRGLLWTQLREEEQ